MIIDIIDYKIGYQRCAWSGQTKTLVNENFEKHLCRLSREPLPLLEN